MDSDSDASGASFFDGEDMGDYLSVQMSNCRGHFRQVHTTVSAQLVVAKRRRGGEDVYMEEFRKAISFLVSTAATELPPALAPCEGLGSLPSCLYKSISLDKLHSFDMGVLRILIDSCHQFFITSATVTISAAQATKTANQRLVDIQRSSKLRKYALFPHGPSDKMAGETGMIRRESCPFIWLCLMGLSDVPPDEDVFVQLCLLINEVNIWLSGINMNYHETKLDMQKIDELQPFCLKASDKQWFMH